MRIQGAERVGESVVSRLDGVRLLVVEDDSDASDLYKFVLTRLGATVTVVGTEREALDSVLCGGVDVIVADVSLGDGNGNELIRQVRQLDRQRGGGIPAVAVSGWARPGDRAKGIDAGFQVYLAKPVEIETLVSVVTRLAAVRSS